jgi:hypothetical protein
MAFLSKLFGKKDRDNENGCLTHTRFTLADDICTKKSLWNAFLLDKAFDYGVLCQRFAERGSSPEQVKGMVLVHLFLEDLYVIDTWDSLLLACSFLAFSHGIERKKPQIEPPKAEEN